MMFVPVICSSKRMCELKYIVSLIIVLLYYIANEGRHVRIIFFTVSYIQIYTFRRLY
jgi:hypothetical protein